MYDTDRVRVGLRIDAIDHEHARVVLLKKGLVVRERRIRNISGLADILALCPVVYHRLVRRVRLWIAEARRVPSAVRLDEDEELARIVCGKRQRQPEPCGSAPDRRQQASEHLTSFHPSSP